MKKFIIIFAIVWIPAMVVQSQIPISAQSLQGKLGKKDLVILQVGNKENYDKEHIPGAQYIGENTFTIDVAPHTFDLPPVNDLQALFESKGISNNTQVVIYTDGNWVSATTRLFFTFDYLGLRDHVSILDGGLIAWKTEGGKTTDEIPSVSKGTLKLTPRTNLVVDKEYIRDNLNSKNVKIVDCRAEAYYQGIEVLEMHGGRKGRIPGAKSIPYTTIFDNADDGSYHFKSPEELKKIFEQQGLSKNDQIIVYCHIGLQLTCVYTASQILGYPNVKVFDGSFHEWGADKSLPVELP